MVCRDKKDLWDGRVRISIRTTSLSLIKLQGFVRVATNWGGGFPICPYAQCGPHDPVLYSTGIVLSPFVGAGTVLARSAVVEAGLTRVERERYN